MLIKINKAETVTLNVQVPYFAKHKEWDWFLLITEELVIEVTPWSIKTEEREGGIFYENKVAAALGHEYRECSMGEFSVAFDKVSSKQRVAVSKALEV